MPVHLLQQLNKRVFFNLLQNLEPKQIELPLFTSFRDLLSADAAKHPLACSCCGWKGSEMKAQKHYLVAGNIAELEFFCPTCNQYLGFLAEPV